MEKKKLELQMPGPDTPGYFRYLKRYSIFASVMSSPANHSPQEIDEAIEWLVSLVKEPTNPKVAREIIVSMSATEIGELIKSIGKAADTTPDPH